jgi:EYA(Eyes Absent) family protein
MSNAAGAVNAGAYHYGAYQGYPNPGDPASVPGYPEGTFSFGGWSGENAYYRNNFTGQSVWAMELFGTPGVPLRPDPKLIGAAIAAAATQRKTWEKHTADQWHHYYQQQAQYAQVGYQPATTDGSTTAEGWGAAHSDQSAATKSSEAVKSDESCNPPGKEVPSEAAQDPQSLSSALTDDSDECSRSAKKQKVTDGVKAGSDGDPLHQNQLLNQHNISAVSLSNIKFGTVYVWDLDETLIVFNSLLTGDFMDSHRSKAGTGAGMSAENARALSSLAEQIEDLVYAVAERAFFFKQLEGRNRPCFGAALKADDGRDLSQYSFASDGLQALESDEGNNRDAGAEQRDEELKVIWRYRTVRDLYVSARAGQRKSGDGGAAATSSPVLEAEREAAEAAIEAVDVLADGWLSTADEVLSSVWQYEAVLDRLPYVAYSAEEDGELVFQPEPTASGAGGAGKGTRSDVNVLVTNGELLPTVAKLLLFGLAKHFHPTCVYSSRDAGKLACFREVVKRFGAAADMVAVGDGVEEETAARRCGIRFVKVEAARDLRRVRDLPSEPAPP